MLKTVRHLGDWIIINKNIKIKVIDIKSRQQVMIGIEAPLEMDIDLEPRLVHEVNLMDCNHDWIGDAVQLKCIKCQSIIDMVPRTDVFEGHPGKPIC